MDTRTAHVLLRLPKPPRKTYIRPDKRESKAVTLVAGFRCSDGLVVCADRQVSSPDSIKYYEPKITIEYGFGNSILFAYSGLPSLAREAREKILRRLEAVGFQAETVYEAADEILTNMGRQYADVQLQLLIGTVDWPDKPSLLKFDGKGLHTADNFSLLGVGDSALIHYLIDAMCSPTQSIQEAINLSIYLASKAKQYIDHVGGKSTWQQRN
jgi:20S proteasome alpha/beta subunit